MGDVCGYSGDDPWHAGHCYHICCLPSAARGVGSSTHRWRGPIRFQHLSGSIRIAVYIMLLPGMALSSELTRLSRRRASLRIIAFSSIAIALFGFLVWAHHMFVSASIYAGSSSHSSMSGRSIRIEVQLTRHCTKALYRLIRDALCARSWVFSSGA